MLNDDVERSLALSPEQRALVSLCNGEAAATESTVTARLVISESVDSARLKTVVEQLLKAHRLLGTALCHVPGLRGLRMGYPEAVPAMVWRESDMRHEEGDGFALSTWIEQFRAQPLAIDEGELVRVGLLRLQDSRYILVLVACALAVDRASLLVLAEQIATGYYDNSSFDLETLFHYSQFVEWREALAADDDASQGQEYWRNYLARKQDLIPPRPGYRSRSDSAPGQRYHIEQHVDEALATALIGAAEQSGCSIATLMQGAWWLLLLRLTDFNAFVGGWQHDCRRDYPVMEGGVGVFEKIMPVIADIDTDESFVQWLARLETVLNRHIEAQEYWSIEAPAITSHLDVGFAFYPIVGDSVWHPVELPGPMPCFELALQVGWTGNAAEVSVYADDARYPTGTITGLLEQYTTLLAGIAAEPGSRVSLLPVVGERERRSLLAINNTALDVNDKTLSDRVAEWAVLTPDAPAIVHGPVEMSYRQLDRQVNRMAYWLRDQNVAKGDLVALNLPRSADLVVAILAVWRAGAGYLPLDPDWPEQRRQTVLAEAKPVLLLDDTHPRPETAGEESCRYVCLSTVEFNHCPDTPIESVTDTSEVAYVLYTSGSTGKPKGVIIEHRQLINYVTAATDAMALQHCHRWALISPVVADLGHTALFGALFNGACLVVADSKVVNDAQEFSRFIDGYRIDALKIVPSHLEALLEVDTPCLPRTIVLGGEAPPAGLIERVKKVDPEAVIFNHYGPTETTVGVVVHKLTADDGLDPIPLTQVLANNQIYVLDKDKQLVPGGGMGEVYIAGAQVCRGYLNLDRGSAFVDNPFEGGERLYRTGDLAYVLPEGGMRLAGRADHQVKIRGYRVEPGEVEAALQQLPGVYQAAVLGRENQAGEQELAAFLVADPEVTDEIDTLRKRLATSLPAFMVPAYFYLVDEFPRVANGKIDRRSLVSSVSSKPDVVPVKNGTPPRCAIEFVLADCMAAVLNKPVVAVEENFFSLGGHSLLAIKLVARIRRVLQIEISPTLVFDHPSVVELAAVICSDNDAHNHLTRLAESYRHSPDSVRTAEERTAVTAE